MVPTDVPGGSQFLFNAYRALLEGVAVSDHFAANFLLLSSVEDVIGTP